MSLEWGHFAVGFSNVALGVLATWYVFRAFQVLFKNPEMLSSQRRLWVPILVGGCFFVVSGVFHFVGHSVLAGSFSNLETCLLGEFFAAIGLSFLPVSLMRYAELQTRYHKIRREAVQRIRS